MDVREEAPKGCKVCNQLLRFWSDLVPNGIELSTDDSIERTEIRIFDSEVVKVKLNNGRS